MRKCPACAEELQDAAIKCRHCDAMLENRRQYIIRKKKYKKFWSELLERSKTKTNLFSNVTAKTYHWLPAGIGKSGISLNYVITNKYAGCELYLSKGEEDERKNENKIWFDTLIKQKDQIEEIFGQSLDWQRLDNKWTSRIVCHYEGMNLQDQKQWPEIKEKLIGTMIMLDKAFRPFVKNLK